MQWAAMDPNQWVFMENEGARIGMVDTPLGLYWRIIEAPVLLWLELPMVARVQVLVDEYASKEMRESTPDWQERMIESVTKLRKSLGDERLEEVVGLLRQDNFTGFARSLLSYYDKKYEKEKVRYGNSRYVNGNDRGAGAGERTILEVQA